MDIGTPITPTTITSIIITGAVIGTSVAAFVSSSASNCALRRPTSPNNHEKLSQTLLYLPLGDAALDAGRPDRLDVQRLRRTTSPEAFAVCRRLSPHQGEAVFEFHLEKHADIRNRPSLSMHFA
jgi:hypothetical protein